MLVLEKARIEYPGLTLTYPDIHVAAGEFVGIAGASGCGKTSLLEALVGQDFAGKFHYERALIAGHDFAGLADAKYRLLSYGPQFSQNALNPKLSVRQHLQLTLKGNQLPYDQSQIEELLGQLSLSTDLLDRFPAMLSGGQKQRFVLFLCAVKQPQLLILDEPSSAIDLITLRDMVQFLTKLRARTTILMVAHSLPLLGKAADRIISL